MRKWIPASFLAVGLIIGAAQPAVAADAPAPTGADPSCVTQVRAAYAKAGESATTDNLGVCVVQSSVTYTEAEESSAVVAPQVGGGPIASKIRSLTGTQEYNLGVPVRVIHEVHSMRQYFDGTAAWSTNSNRGKVGYHTCQTGSSYAVGYDVSVTSCDHQTRDTSDLLGETFRVSFAVKGSPISWTVQMAELTSRAGVRKQLTNY